MRWLTITLPKLEKNQLADFDEFRSKFKFDPNFMKQEFLMALTTFHEISKEIWNITPESKPCEILAASLKISAYTIIRCVAGEVVQSPSDKEILVDAMVAALREFEEEHRTFSTSSAFINYVKVKIYREALNDSEIDALMLFHQLGIALYDLNAFSEQSILNRVAVVTQKSFNKWSNRAHRAVEFSSDVASKSYDFFIQYGKLCYDVIGFDRLVLNIKEGRNCLTLKIQQIEESETIKSTVAAIQEWNGFVSDKKEDLSKYLIEHKNTVLLYLEENKDHLTAYLKDSYKNFDIRKKIPERLISLLTNTKDLSGEIIALSSITTKHYFEEIIKYFRANKKQLMELIVRVRAYEKNLISSVELKIEDIRGMDLEQVCKDTLAMVKRSLDLRENLKKLTFLSDLWLYQSSLSKLGNMNLSITASGDESEVNQKDCNTSSLEASSGDSKEETVKEAECLSQDHINGFEESQAPESEETLIENTEEN
jgi:hypothetical protein